MAELFNALIAGCVPDRVLFVAKGYTGPRPPGKTFTTIPAALVAAAALVPTSTSPVAIIVAPGTYSDPFSMVPWVTIKAASILSVIIDGAWDFTPVGAIDEIIEFENVRFEGGGTGTIDTTGKTGGQGNVVLLNVVRDASITYTGRALFSDVMICIETIDFVGATLDVSDILLIVTGGISSGIAVRGASQSFIQNALILADVHAFDTSVIFGANCEMFGPLTAESGTFVLFNSSTFNSSLEAKLGAIIDARGSEILGGEGAIIGPGQIDRSIIQQFITTAFGANAIVFAAPLASLNYTVAIMMQGAGPVPLTVSVTAKAVGGFTLNEGTVGGRDYDLTIFRE